MNKNRNKLEYRGEINSPRPSDKKRNRSAKIILWGSLTIILFVVTFITLGIITISDTKNIQRRPFSLSVDSMLNTPLPTQAPSQDTQQDKKTYIAITFDDGPYAPTTKKVLNALNERNIKATFFVIGYRAEINKKLIQEMIEQGHEIGNHSWDHPDYTTLSKTEIKQQQEQCSAIVEQYTGQKLRISRPPYGGNNEKVDKVCNTPIVLWSMDSLDWKETDRHTLIKRVVNQTKPGDIILMHDLQKITAECVDEILDGLLAKGYIPVTVSELIAVKYGTTLQRGNIYYDVNNIIEYQTSSSS